MRAASRISPGMPSENCFMRKTPKGQPTVGKITAQMLSHSPMAEISLMRGMRITCLGRAMAQTMREKRSARPGNRFFARAYPAMEAVMQVRTMAITAINTVLRSHRMAAGNWGPESIMVVLSGVNIALKGTASSHRGAVRRANSRAKLSRVKTVGNHTGVTELYSLAILKAPVTIQ